MRRRHPLLLGTAIALAGAAPAGAAEVQVQALDTLAWDPPSVAVQPGDTVNWRFDGTTGLHNVVVSGPATSYRTEPGRPSATGTFTFATPGNYLYVCEVHADAMRGTLVVGDPPPPPLSEQPFPNDSALPAALETGGLDEERPSLGGVRVRRTGGATELRFRVSEPSDVTLRFKRGGKTAATRHVRAAGVHRLAVRPSRSLPAGSYRVELRARDGAGNASRLRSARLTVR